MQIIDEIKTTLDYFLGSSENVTDHKEIGAFFMSGGASSTFNLAKEISNKFSKKTTVINPFNKIKTPRSLIQYVANNGQCFGISSGLSLRKFFYSK